MRHINCFLLLKLFPSSLPLSYTSILHLFWNDVLETFLSLFIALLLFLPCLPSFLPSLPYLIPPFLPCSCSTSALDVSSPRPPSFLTLVTARGDHHLSPCVALWLMFSGPSHCFSFPAHLMAHKLKPKGLFRLAERSKPTLNGGKTRKRERNTG